MALATVERLAFAYAGEERPALTDVSLSVGPGEMVLLAGGSGSGKTTLVRALAGLVPHFHGGRYSGRVEVAGLDTRTVRPAELAGTVATLFQEPEEQVVFGAVDAEVAFGLENAGVPAREIEGRVREALAAVGAEHLRGRQVGTLSGGELQRVCLAATLALEPALLLLDEPTSQLDAAGAASLLRLLRRRTAAGMAVVLAEQRVTRALRSCDRVVALDAGRVVLDAPCPEARRWLRGRPDAGMHRRQPRAGRAPGETLCRVDGVHFAYGGGQPVLDAASLELRRGEIVALTGANGSGKTTLAKIAAGLLEPCAGTVARRGRAGLLTQDPGRFLVRERVDEEVALGARDASAAARALAAVGLGGLEARHPQDLSSGERERLALAAVLATEPDVLVLDEPTRGVDVGARRRIAALLRAGAPSRATLLVTHDPDLVEAVADRVVDISEGRSRAAA